MISSHTQADQLLATRLAAAPGLVRAGAGSWDGSRTPIHPLSLESAYADPRLLRDLGAPFPAVWDHFHAAHPPREAARLFAKVLGHLDTHGVDVVVPAVERALRTGTPVLLALTPSVSAAALLEAEVVPAVLRDLDVASGCAADYDRWLAEAV